MFPFQHWMSCSRLFIFPAPSSLIFSTSVILKPGRIHIKSKWVFKRSWFRVELSVKQWVKQTFIAMFLWKTMESLCTLTSERHKHDYFSSHLHNIRIKCRNIHSLKDMAWQQKGSKGSHRVTQRAGRWLPLKTALENHSWKQLFQFSHFMFDSHLC